ncbi:MAG: HAD-IA family hydrolase [Candidatus Woesearchaeota archaeon]
MRSYTFRAKGHPNILAMHRSTLELTKDPQVSATGDCIICAGAEFSVAGILKVVKGHKRIRMTISAGDISEKIDFEYNQGFCAKNEIVLRLSDFESDRTLGTRASKAAKHIDRKLVSRLKDPDQVIMVTIEPFVKAVIFDLDNTIADLSSPINHAHEKIAEYMFKKYGVYGPTTVELLQELDMDYSLKGVSSSPSSYDRRIWFRDYFRMVGIDVTSKEIDATASLYWKLVIEKTKLLPHALIVLRSLQKKYSLVLLTDSDGEKRIKLERIKKMGLDGMFDIVVISDDIGVNKPNMKCYEKIFKELDVTGERCVMVGDKPQVDLELAKKIGMMTIWMKHGRWAEVYSGTCFDFVDHEISDLRKVCELVKSI